VQKSKARSPKPFVTGELLKGCDRRSFRTEEAQSRSQTDRSELSFDDSRNVMTKNVQIPDSRIVWPPHYAPASSIVFAQNNIDIAATPERVWSLLIDCVQWPSWYKHCTDVSMLRGGPLLSAQSKFRFKTLGFYFEPDIETFEPFKMLIWSAKCPRVVHRTQDRRLPGDHRGGAEGLAPGVHRRAYATHASHVARRVAPRAQGAG
jgi:hypothetical protein